MTAAIRRADTADADAIADLFARSFTATFGHNYTPENLDAFLDRCSPASFATELADPAYALWIAEADGRAVAFAKLGPPSLPFEPIGRAIELRQLYVDAGHHGTGVAAALTDALIAEARARGADEIYLSVFVDNQRAKRFYARYGFERVGSYAFMVGDHEDEDDVMRLAL